LKLSTKTNNLIKTKKRRRINLDEIKDFNHSYNKPLIAIRLNPNEIITKKFNLNDNNEDQVLLIDYLSSDGQDLTVEINYENDNDSPSTYGKVFIYKCNITTLCRQVILSNQLNEPLVIKGNSNIEIIFKSLAPPTSGSELMIYKATLVPKKDFNINHIKMAPYCIVKDKKCEPMNYKKLTSEKLTFQTDEFHDRQDLYGSYRSSSNYTFIPNNNVIYLFNYYVK
jgi:hypothetical protein